MRSRALGALVALALLAAVTALGGLLRFSHPERMGPYLIDDGFFGLEGQFFYTTAKAIGESAGRWVQERRTGVDLWKREAEVERVGREIGSLAMVPKLAYARPLTSLSVAAAMGFLGGPKPYAGGFMAAFYGTLTIPVVFLILWRSYNARAGLYGALLLAVGGAHVMYSRAGLAEAPSVFFITCAVLCYLESLRTSADRSLLRAFGAGACWGLAVAAQDRWLVMSGLLWAAEAYLWLRTRKQAEFTLGLRAARVASILGGMALAMALFELPYYGAMIALRNLGRPLPFPTYFEALLYHIAWGFAKQPPTMIGSVGWFDWSNFLFFPYFFATLVGPVGCALALGGLVLCLRERSSRSMTLALWLLLPLLFYSKSRAVARYASIMLPALAVLGGAFLADLRWARRRFFSMRKFDERSPAVFAAIAAAILTGLYPAFQAMERATSGYAEAVGKIPPNDRMFTTALLSTAYLAGLDRVDLEAPRSLEELRAKVEGGVRWYVVDVWRWYAEDLVYKSTGYRPPPDHASWGMLSVMEQIEGAVKPAFVAPNPFVTFPGSLLEANFAFFASMRFLRDPPPGAEEIRVYDLREFLATLPPPAAPAESAPEPSPEAGAPPPEAAPAP